MSPQNVVSHPPDARELTRSYVDNGFSSADAMADMHRVMIDAAVGLLRGRTGKVLDLGCGNGLLVLQIATRMRGVRPWGVECVRDKADRARAALEKAGGRLYCGDFFSPEHPWFDGEPYQLTLLMIGRLLEVGLRAQRALVRNIERHSNLLLLYTYGDPLSMSDEATELLVSTLPGAMPLDVGAQAGSLPRLWVYDTAGQRSGRRGLRT